MKKSLMTVENTLSDCEDVNKSHAVETPAQAKARIARAEKRKAANEVKKNSIAEVGKPIAKTYEMLPNISHVDICNLLLDYTTEYVGYNTVSGIAEEIVHNKILNKTQATIFAKWVVDALKQKKQDFAKNRKNLIASAKNKLTAEEIDALGLDVDV